MRIEKVKIYTMNSAREVIDCGFVEFENGKITAIGKCEGRAKGLLFPGFIDGHTHLGIVEDSIGFEGDDTNETGDPITPHLRAIDAVNPFDRCFEEAREAGVTCAAAGPGSANPIGGQFAAFKTVGKRADTMAVKSPAAMKMALGENPKGVYHAKNQSPETRMATAAMIRENLIKAKKYAEDLQKAHEKPENPDDEAPDEPEFDIKLDALVPVVRGELPVHFHAHRADDIFTAIRIAKEFNLKYSIVHCTEGHLIKEELKEENITAFTGPNICDRSKPELKSQTFKNPGELSNIGITVGITTDHPVIPLQYLPLCAALAVKSGMKEDDALAAITINPAKILGIEDHVGSIEVGKDADFSLFEKHPFDVSSAPKSVWINGIKCK